ncbi:MAG: HPP family protein [Dehalococcoidales bacterium]|nr:HPP family protein [Dehalococcoidales bacterium]MDZ4230631.1 HPP family protein [Dehalococcoidales bacterium]
MEIIDKSFLRAPKSYIVQSFLAVVTLGLILYFVEVLTHAAVVAALGSSAFIVFAMPHSITARPRRLLGGHIVGLLSGIILRYIFLTSSLGRQINGREFLTLFVYALAVGLAIFLMTITNTEHPPAAGTALAMVAHQWSYPVVFFILLSVAGLAIVRRLLNGHLRDLF